VDQLAPKATALTKMYLPALQSQFKQLDGDWDGAVGDYKEAVLRLKAGKQFVPAGRLLTNLAIISEAVGKTPAALAFTEQQKLDGNELQPLAIDQTLAGNRAASQETLQKLAEVQPWLAPSVLRNHQAAADAEAALGRRDGAAALVALGPQAKLYNPGARFMAGRAHLLTKDYAAAEDELHAAIRITRSMANLGQITGRLPLVEILSHFYLGQVYEQTGKRDQAINEYQEFLAHFENSKTKLAQVDEARAALKRLMQ
jgi:tetratricopeptide (TPR) repeat protein